MNRHDFSKRVIVSSNTIGNIKRNQVKHLIKQGHCGLLRTFSDAGVQCGSPEKEQSAGFHNLQTLGFFVHDHSGAQCPAETLKEVLTYGDADMAPGDGNY